MGLKKNIVILGSTGVLGTKLVNFLHKNSYNILHYYEKWIKDSYISSYQNIELDIDKLNSILNSIINKNKIL